MVETIQGNHVEQKVDWRDPVVRYPRLSNSDFKKLTVLTCDDQKVNPVRYWHENTEITVYSNLYIDQLDKDKCMVRKGKVSAEYKKELIYKATLPATYPLLKTNFRHMADFVDNNGRNMLVKVNCSDANWPYLLSFFAIYDDFGPFYKEYLLNLDPDFAISDQRITGKLHLSEGKIKLTDVKATVHLLLVLMNNPFPEGNQVNDHVNNYLNNRLKVIRNLLGDNEADFLLNRETVVNLIDMWNNAPGLKKTIFMMALGMRSKHKEISSAFMLLAESSMEILYSIAMFIRCEITTQAHALTQVWEEIESFLSQVEDLKRTLGCLWPYYCTLMHNDDRLESVKFPNLSHAAVIYVKTFSSESQKNIAVPNHPVCEGLSEAAESRLDESCKGTGNFQQKLAHLRPQLIRIVENFDVDLLKWRIPQTLRADLMVDIPEQQLNEFQESADLLNKSNTDTNENNGDDSSAETGYSSNPNDKNNDSDKYNDNEVGENLNIEVKATFALLKELLPEYDGTTDPAMFVSQVRNIQKFYSLDVYTMKALLMSKVKGKVQTWLYSKSNFIYDDLDNLLHEMIILFSEEEIRLNMRRKFEVRKWQPDEDFSTYFKNKILLADHLNMPEALLIDFIIDGIPSNNLREIAYRQCFQSKAQLLRTFSKISLGEQENREPCVSCSSCDCNTPRINIDACYACGSMDHPVAACPKLKSAKQKEKNSYFKNVLH